MTRVRYIADSMTEAITAARRQHGMGVRIVHAGARRTGTFGRALSFEVIIEAASRTAQARRAAREALARAVMVGRMAADEANASMSRRRARFFTRKPGRWRPATVTPKQPNH